MPEHDTRVVPLKSAKEFDPLLQVRVRRIWGYEARCKCGWKSKRYDSYGEAGTRAIQHKLGMHTPDPIVAA